MRWLYLLSISLAFSLAAAAPPPVPATGATAPPLGAARGEIAAREPQKTVRYALYKFMQRIGIERDTYTPTVDGGTEAKAIFSFQDRGSPVPLTALYRLAPDGSPLRYQAWGNTARGASIDDRVVARGGGSFDVYQQGEGERRVEQRGPLAALSGYAPMLGQQILLSAWSAHGRPATLSLLPSGTARITSRGKESFPLEGKTVTFEHLAVVGLVWGREDVWIDDAGELAAVVTRDAEFDHFEAVRDRFIPLLPELTRRAATDAVSWLAEVSADRSPRGAVALVGGRLVDGTGRAPIADSVVVYDGDRIVAAGPRAATPIPAGATLLDAAGQTVLPGLWDMHAHLEQVEQGAVYLAVGVTTVRDLGNILEFITAVRDAIAAGKGLGPRVLVSGLVDGDGRQSLGTLRINKLADIDPMLDRLKLAGCLEVKIYSSIRPELVKPIADAAHRRGLRVTGHIPEDMDLMQALDAGFDGINHLPYVTDVVLPRSAREKLSPAEVRRRLGALDLRSPEMQRVLDKLAAKRTLVDDTLVLFDLFRHTTEENLRREPGINKLPRELRSLFDGVDKADAAEHAAVFDKLVAVLGELHRRGVPIIAGTDIAVPGHSLHRELELYVQAGMTPMEAIQAATLVPARAMGLAKELGTIEAGKRADLVVIAGNPLADIRELRKVARVVARGRLYDPASLFRLVGFTP
ncbi:MAG: amidohydrolase family protein [Polyangia bacterium]